MKAKAEEKAEEIKAKFADDADDDEADETSEE